MSEANADFAKMGIQLNGGKAKMDVGKMLAQKNKAVKGLTSGIEGLFKKNGVTYVKGAATLTGKDSIDVDVNPAKKGDAPKRETIRAKNIILATGSESSPMPGGSIKPDEKVVVTSTGALDMKAVPKKMLVVGGGVIGLELGSVWNRLGAKVEVVEYMDCIAPPLDGDMRTALQKALTKQGIKFHLSSKVTGATVTAKGATVHWENSKGKQSLEVDNVLLSVGRRPFTSGLGLEELSIEKDKMGRVVVDSSLRVPSMPNIFAIGDIVSGPMLAHKAEEEGLAVASMLGGETDAVHVDYDCIPNVVYTHPELAGVGLTEEQVKEAGTPYTKATFPFMANSRARTNDDADGLVKVMAHRDTGLLLGAWIFGPSAGELIAELVLAMRKKLRVQDVAHTCHAHPTLSEAVMEACLAASPGGKAIHFA